jgi:D-3-phosphoglycerate dehydrogenase / 2-oxoglutarate reductase
MKMKILANDGIAPEGRRELEKAGFMVITEKVAQDKLVEFINSNDVVALLVRSATEARKDLIDACSGLKLIGRGGVGMDNIDVDYARSKGIKVINTPASSSQSVAELVFAHLFSMARFVYDSNREMPVKGSAEFEVLKKKYSKGIELRGKTIGIIGFGRIGQSVAKYALGLGMKVLAFDPHHNQFVLNIEVPGTNGVDVKIDSVEMSELFAHSDFITLHVPKQKDGKAVIGKDDFRKMKKGVMLVNTARGGIIDEQSLIEALNDGTVSHAALDVFVNEPKPSPEILSHPKISLTPHIGAATNEAQARIGTELAEQIIAHFSLVKA